MMHRYPIATLIWIGVLCLCPLSILAPTSFNDLCRWIENVKDDDNRVAVYMLQAYLKSNTEFINMVTNQGQTLLMLAAQSKGIHHVPVVRALVDCYRQQERNDDNSSFDVWINQVDICGHTALMLAVKNKSYNRNALVRELIRQGADVYAMNWLSQIARDFADDFDRELLAILSGSDFPIRSKLTLSKKNESKRWAQNLCPYQLYKAYNRRKGLSPPLRKAVALCPSNSMPVEDTLSLLPILAFGRSQTAAPAPHDFLKRNQKRYRKMIIRRSVKVYPQPVKAVIAPVIAHMPAGPDIAISVNSSGDCRMQKTIHHIIELLKELDKPFTGLNAVSFKSLFENPNR